MSSNSAACSNGVLCSNTNQFKDGKPKAGRLFKGRAIGKMGKGKCGALVCPNPACLDIHEEVCKICLTNQAVEVSAGEKFK
jgi:hypothetical protein